MTQYRKQPPPLLTNAQRDAIILGVSSAPPETAKVVLAILQEAQMLHRNKDDTREEWNGKAKFNRLVNQALEASYATGCTTLCEAITLLTRDNTRGKKLHQLQPLVLPVTDAVQIGIRLRKK